MECCGGLAGACSQAISMAPFIFLLSRAGFIPTELDERRA
jgi:hypothetical protein